MSAQPIEVAPEPTAEDGAQDRGTGPGQARLVAGARPTAEARIKAARWFAGRGFGVLALWSTDDAGKCRCPKPETYPAASDACTPGKHPVSKHGVKDATTDPGRIAVLLDKPSMPNLGLTPPARVVTLDVDGEGRERLVELEARHGPLPETMRTLTANGQHIVLALDPERDPGGDLFGFVTRRHMTGYVVGPRSWHPTGVAYDWNGIEHIAPMPEAWIEAARSGRTVRIGRPGPESVPVGQRHFSLRDTARHYAGTVRDPDALRAAVLAWNAKLPEPKTPAEVDRAIGRAPEGFAPDPAPVDPGPDGLRSAAGITPRRVGWLWRGWVPAGKVTMLDGRPGLGKSGMTLDLAARVTRGQPMPDGSAGIEPGNAIVITAEDDWEDTVVPRLMAAGADLGRIFPVYELELPRGADDLGALVEQVAARLVVIDPLVAFVPGSVNLYRDQDARLALKPLAAAMARTGCAAICLRHVSKASGIPAQDRGTGSVGIGGAARSNLIVGPDPDREGFLVLASIKNNLGPRPEALSYEITGRLVELPDGTTEVPGIHWHGGIDLDADDLVLPGKQGEAVRWLERLLADGPRPVRDIEAAAQSEGMSFTGAIRRAATRLGVVKTTAAVGKRGIGWTWALPEMYGTTPPLNTLNTLNTSHGDEQEMSVLSRGLNTLNSPDEPGADAARPDLTAAAESIFGPDGATWTNGGAAADGPPEGASGLCPTCQVGPFLSVESYDRHQCTAPT